MKIDKVKVSELPEIEDVANFDALGVDRQSNRSVKVRVSNLVSSKQDKLTAGNGIELNNNVISIEDTGWVVFTSLSPEILEADGEMEYRRIGSMLYFKYTDGNIILHEPNIKKIIPIVDPVTIGISEAEIVGSVGCDIPTQCYLYPVATSVYFGFNSGSGAICLRFWGAENYIEMELYNADLRIILDKI